VYEIILSVLGRERRICSGVCWLMELWSEFVYSMVERDLIFDEEFSNDAWSFMILYIVIDLSRSGFVVREQCKLCIDCEIVWGCAWLRCNFE